MSTVTSCEECPQRVPFTDIGERLLKTINYGEGLDYCAAKHIPLGRPHNSPSQISEVMVSFADGCNDSNNAAPDFKLKTQIGRVASPTVAVMPREEGEVAASDCRSCSFYVPPSEVRGEYGWGMGLCGAQGTLIPPNQLRKTAQRCSLGRDASVASPELPKVGPNHLALLPAFGAITEVTPVTGATSVLAKLPDPNDYVSDCSVSEEDSEAGIRAWRELQHPKHGGALESVWWPIFDPEFFDDRLARKIPKMADDGRPESYVDHQHLMYFTGADFTNGLSPLLVGPAGTGKTEFFRYLAWMCQLPFDRVSVTGSTEVADIIGKHLVKVDPTSGESVTEWVNGVIPNAWTTPGVIVIDEPNLGPKEVVEAIRPMIDSVKQLVIAQDEGQILNRDKYRFLGMAMNPSHDLRYQGTNDMNEADLNRLTSFSVDFPAPEVERDILINACSAKGYSISNEKLNEIMKLTEDLRLASDPTTGSLSFSWGMRIMITLALSTRYKTLEEATRSAVADRLDPDERQEVLAYVKSLSTGI